MERSRLKNIIILILVLVNLFLLISLAMQRSAKRDDRRRTVRELTALFAADGIELENNAVPDVAPPASKSLARDAAEDQRLASFLLGNDLTGADEGGGIYSYESGSGQAVLRSSGSFDITGALRGGEGVALCQSFCETFGYENLTLAQSGESATAVQYYDGYPVYNGIVHFTLTGGKLIAVRGSHVPNVRSESSESYTMTSATALMHFLEYRRQSGAVVSRVLFVHPCYELQSTPAYPIVLVPAWQIETDTANYYVSCSTGTVTRN